MPSPTRTVLVSPHSGSADYQRIRLPRCPWETALSTPDPRPETAPRRDMARGKAPVMSPAERVAMVKRTIAEIAAEAQGHG